MSITVTNAGDSLHYVDDINDIDVYFNKDSFQSRRKDTTIWLNDETYKEQFDFSEVDTAEPTATLWLKSLNMMLGVGGSQSALSTELFAVVSSDSVDANSVGTEYMVLAVRQVVEGAPIVLNSSVMASTNDNFILRARLNPTINNSGALVWASLGPYLESSEAESGNPTPSTVTGGTVLGSALSRFQQGQQVVRLNVGLALNDVLVVTAEPFSTNLDITGTINTKQR